MTSPEVEAGIVWAFAGQLIDGDILGVLRIGGAPGARPPADEVLSHLISELIEVTPVGAKRSYRFAAMAGAENAKRMLFCDHESEDTFTVACFESPEALEVYCKATGLVSQNNLN